MKMLNNFIGKMLTQAKMLLKFNLLISAGAIILALISQYVFKLEPCHLCLEQRIPFYAMILIVAIALLMLKTRLRIIVVPFFKLNQANVFKSEAEQAYINTCAKAESCQIRLDHLIMGIGIILCTLLFIYNSGLAFYHVGVEKGVFIIEAGCGDSIDAASSSQMLQQLLAKPYVPCDKPQFVLFGISMAGYNFILCFIMSIINLIFCIKNRKLLLK